jgi:acetyl-CoA C-acetyltransferase
MSFREHEIVISTPLRTAIGSFGGTLKDVPAAELGATVARAILSRTQLPADQIDQVIVGNVLQAGQGMNPGRQVGLKAGLPAGVPAMTINRVCGSGLQAIVSAAEDVALGESQVILAGGIENMDLAPFLLPKARYGYRMGMPGGPGGELLDSMVVDGLWDVFNNYHMGVTAENVAQQYGISREDADAFSLRSHQRAAKAITEGYFADQIVPVAIQQKQETLQFAQDEHVRTNATLEGFARLKPVFKQDGSVTAGNASGINDGAGFLLVTTAGKARDVGLPIAGQLISFAIAGVDPAYMGTGPIPSIRQALKKADLTVDDVAVFEINEAFASIALAAQRALDIPDEKLNPNGGAVALGHPIGATGAILTVKALHELARQQARYGVVSLCIGGGMGIAAVFEHVA